MSELIHEIAQLIENASGFVIGDQNTDGLASFVQGRVARGRFAGVERYIDYLRRHPDSEEWRHLLSKITIKESYLFRARAQFEALADTILGEIAGRRTDQRLRVWCAGCARGEEAATLAIVLADHPIIGGWQWSVLATDVDETALADAERGVYGPRAIGRVPIATLERHFVRHDLRYVLQPDLLRRIEYRRLNLVEQPLDLADELFDVIFLRNVLIYFRPEIQRRVIESVEEALESDGTVFLGPSESLIHLGTSLQARDLGGCFCYRRPSTPGDDGAEAGCVNHTARPAAVSTADSVPMPRLPLVDVDEAPPFEVRLEAMIRALEKGATNGRLRVWQNSDTSFRKVQRPMRSRVLLSSDWHFRRKRRARIGLHSTFRQRWMRFVFFSRVCSKDWEDRRRRHENTGRPSPGSVQRTDT